MNVLRPVIWAEDNLGLFLRCEGNPRLATPILGALTNTFSGNPLVMGGRLFANWLGSLTSLVPLLPHWPCAHG